MTPDPTAALAEALTAAVDAWAYEWGDCTDLGCPDGCWDWAVDLSPEARGMVAAALEDAS